MRDALKAGDRVKLKSGGPVMTVAVTEGPCVRCVWFHADGMPREQRFLVAVLRRF